MTTQIYPSDSTITPRSDQTCSLCGLGREIQVRHVHSVLGDLFLCGPCAVVLELSEVSSIIPQFLWEAWYRSIRGVKDTWRLVLNAVNQVARSVHTSSSSPGTVAD